MTTAPHTTTTKTWSNWYGNVQSSPQRIASPDNEESLRSVLADAIRQGRNVRPVGAGHSNVPVAATDGILLSLERMSGLRHVDTTAHTATFGPGTRIADIGPALWKHGLSLMNQGDINTQHLAGAVSTGTHGTGITLGSFSGSVAAARLMRPNGEVLVLDNSNLPTLRAARTSLGTLGIFTELTLNVTEAFSLELNLEVTDWRDLLARWDELLASHRHFTFYWCPTGENPWAPVSVTSTQNQGGLGRETVIIKTMDPLPAGAASSGKKFDGRFVAPAHEVWPDPYEPDFHEMEYMVPVEDGKAAVSRIRDLIREEYPNEWFPVEVRFCAADDAMLSPMAGRATCVISISGEMGKDNSEFFRACDRALADYLARPHWGKWHEFTSDDLLRVYPEFDSFSRIRRELDPEGILLNPYLRSMFASEDIG